MIISHSHRFSFIQTMKTAGTSLGRGITGRTLAAACGAAVVIAFTASPRSAGAEEIGSVTTAIKILGANHRIVIEAFDDPKVEGVSCFLSRARTGGIKGSLGVAEDTSDASVSCQQTGPVRFREAPEDGEQVFSVRASLIFKHVQVVRFFDETRNTLIYLTYSDRVIEGSPKNSISAVAIRDWQTAPSTTQAVQ